jgi:murein DD-endopeptidase MepM/ murein hydrolase activator NlpD
MLFRIFSIHFFGATLITMLILMSPVSQITAEESRNTGRYDIPGKLAKETVSRTVPLMVSPIVWSVVSVPILPVKGTDGLVHLVYELNVRNDSRHTLDLTALDTLDSRTGQHTGRNQAVSLDGQDISGEIRPFALTNPSQTSTDFSNQLGPGQGGVIYFDLTYSSARDVPPCLKHRVSVSFQKADKTPQSYTTEDECTVVSRERTLVIQPPLEGDGWLNANGSGPIISPHRYSTQATNGILRSPEHFAIDFVKLDHHGKLNTGDPNDNASFFGYGLNVRSATSGRVIEMLDGIPNQIPGQLVPPQEASQYGGNHVIVEIGSGKYAFYAHLAPGSVKVRQGDHVGVGQILGKVGNSGNSDAPHLHFQIMDSASPFNTNGLPFVFNQINYRGQLKGTVNSVMDSLFNGIGADIEAIDASRRQQQMPLTLDLVNFQ